MIKTVYELTKFKLVHFVILSGLAGFFLGMPVEETAPFKKVTIFLLGLITITMGSFALNQFMERTLDSQMPRTQGRPIPSGRLSPQMAVLIAFIFILLGTYLLRTIEPLAALFGVSTVLMYNVIYTLIWKPKWTFGAVPGAIPGAMPVVIAYVAATGTILTKECLYIFLILFLWQMPHFWALALRFKKDYEMGGVPVMPSVLGAEKAKLHMLVYTCAYVGLALVSPLFVSIWYAYWVLVLPFSFVVALEFYRYFKSQEERSWLRFFLWVNFSLLAFLIAPVVDKWGYIFIKSGF